MGAALAVQSYAKEKTTEAHAVEDGQQGSDFIHQSHGRDKVPIAVPCSMSTLGMVSPEGSNSLSRAPARLSQHNGRPGSLELCSPRRSGDFTVAYSREFNVSLPLHSGPLCIEIEQTTPTVRQLEA